MSSSIDALFRAGTLDAAVAAATDAVRKDQTDVEARIRLAELLIFTGNLERADVLLNAAAALDRSAASVIAEFRQLLRAETARLQFWRDGRLPEIVAAPTAAQKDAIAAAVAWRGGDPKVAARMCESAEASRPPSPVRAGNTTYTDFRDADDLCGGNLELLTTTVKFYWLPISFVETITFHPPCRPRDLTWRRADISVTDGPEGTVYLPVLYASAEPSETDTIRLGRETAWTSTTPVLGRGQRVFLCGDEGIAIMDLTELHFQS